MEKKDELKEMGKKKSRLELVMTSRGTHSDEGQDGAGFRTGLRCARRSSGPPSCPRAGGAAGGPRASARRRGRAAGARPGAAPPRRTSGGGGAAGARGPLPTGSQSADQSQRADTSRAAP